MIDQQQITKWVSEGTITQAQADKMLLDVAQQKKERTSGKLVVTISTIGAVLLGIGAILFVSSNWDQMSSLLKSVILLASTFLAYGIGFHFQYGKKNYPKVGAALLFLGAMLFGASVFLIAQIYHVNANAHVLLLIWLIGVLPFVYAFSSTPVAALSAVLFFLWLGFFVFRGTRLFDAFADIRFLPAMYLICGVMVFGIGAMHYFADGLKKVARIFRIGALKVLMVSLFLLTFEEFSGVVMRRYNGELDLLSLVSGQFKFMMVIFSLVAIFTLLINWFFNPSKSKTSAFESWFGFGMVGLTLFFFFFPPASSVYIILFNLLMVAVIGTFLWIGHKREDMKLVNMGMFWTAVFIFARYFDFFWDLLSRSVFFMVGGLILVLGGIALEKKRREIKQEFGTHQVQS